MTIAPAKRLIAASSSSKTAAGHKRAGASGRKRPAGGPNWTNAWPSSPSA
jgi:hypothetical protein